MSQRVGIAEATVNPWNPPDRLCAQPGAPYYSAEWLAICVCFLNGNAVRTGFLYEYCISERWVTLLKREGDRREGGILRDPNHPWHAAVPWLVKKSGKIEVFNVHVLNRAEGNA